MFSPMTLAIVAQEEAESTSNVSLVLPETNELIAGIVAFAIVFFFVWKWALPAINRILEARQQAIVGRLDDAEKAKTDAEKLRADYERQVSEARAKGNQIIEDARKTAEQLKDDMVERAQSEAEGIISQSPGRSRNREGPGDGRSPPGSGQSHARPGREGSRTDASTARPSLGWSSATSRSWRASKWTDPMAAETSTERPGTPESIMLAGYGSAIFEVAKAEGQLERVEGELFTVARTFATSNELRDALTNPQLPIERKQGIIDDLIGGRASILSVGLCLVPCRGRSSSRSPGDHRRLHCPGGGVSSQGGRRDPFSRPAGTRGARAAPRSTGSRHR